jgi:Ferredoxin-like domain in Api92-like protein
MANVCSCTIEITGMTESVQTLGDKIKNQDSDLEELFPWFLAGKGKCYGLVDGVDDIICEDKYIKLEFDCKWGPPVDGLIKLSNAYPDYLIEAVYRESGMALYGKVKFRGGDKVEDVSFTKEEYLDAYDEEYNELVSGIEEEEYESFLKDHDKYLGDIENFYYLYPELVEKHVLKRFQDKDLGLLINYQWNSEVNRKEYEWRLKGGK